MSRPDFSTELVPLADRLRVMQLVRLLLVAIALAHVAAAPEAWSVGLGAVSLLVVAYVALTGTGYVVWRMYSGRGITLFGAMLIVDGFLIAALAALSGGVDSPAAYLVLPHCMMVALLASYRSAAKIALWHTLLAFAVHQADEANLLPAITGEARPGGPVVGLVTFSVLTWLAALGTASFAAMNERELRRRKVDLEDLARMATALEMVSTPASVGGILADSLVDAYGFTTAAVLTVDGDRLVPLAGVEGAPSTPGAFDRIVTAAWEHRTTQLVAHLDGARDPYLTSLFRSRRNVLVAPLFADGRPVGVVVAEHGLRRGSRIERRVVAMVERFCGHGSLALRNAWLLEEVQQLAATDALTRVANRRTFEETLERELSRAARAGTSVALVMVDVDHFKRLNDTHGHRTGDEVLRAVAGAIVAHTRDYDLVARYGGEEFAVVLPGCDSDAAAGLAERMREAIESLDSGPSVTASLGVAVGGGLGTDGEALVRAADAALYEAKRQGRNRVLRSLEAVA
ncbi:MAG TPA: sensor domain-containing diguanylate cyclase [Acidimicrobiales bacterium]